VDATYPSEYSIIVVTTREWCSREMTFLREELIAEGFPGGAGVHQNYQ
jgi:hypothetical protein